MFRLPKPVLLAAALVPLAAVAVSLYSCRRTPPEQSWTVERLKAVLEADGAPYKGRWLQGKPGQYGGYYLWRTGESVEAIAALIPQRFIAAPGRLRIEPIPTELATKGELYADEADGKLRLGTLMILGHPEELRRVAEAVR